MGSKKPAVLAGLVLTVMVGNPSRMRLIPYLSGQLIRHRSPWSMFCRVQTLIPLSITYWQRYRNLRPEPKLLLLSGSDLRMTCKVPTNRNLGVTMDLRPMLTDSLSDLSALILTVDDTKLFVKNPEVAILDLPHNLKQLRIEVCFSATRQGLDLTSGNQLYVLHPLSD